MCAVLALLAPPVILALELLLEVRSDPLAGCGVLDNLRRGERGLVELMGDLLGATGSDGPTVHE
jgi:hypothetical protein